MTLLLLNWLEALHSLKITFRLSSVCPPKP
jgi:hypothetical protein